MALKSLGIDISDSHVTGVVLEQQRKNVTLSAIFSLPFAEGDDPAAYVLQLCRQLDWQEGVCVCGLPLSMLSVRNLALPFKDDKKIAQALPFEMEEQLIVPIDTLVTDFIVGKKDDAGSLIVAFSVERAFLSGLLAGVRDLVDPDVVTPAMVPLVNQVIRHNRDKQNFLLIHADLHSSTMALILDDKAVFYRRLAYPEEMVLHPPFHYEDGRVVITDGVAAEESIRLFCRLIERGLDYFQMENSEEGRPVRVFLTGPLAEMTLVSETLHSVLGLPVETPDILSANGIFCSEDLAPQYRGRHFDRALSLALQGFGRSEINFRKQVFAKQLTFFSARKHVLMAISVLAVAAIGLFGYLGYDYYRLQQRDKALGEEMTAIFKDTFPGVTRVQDPFVDMQARLKAVQGPDAPSPLLYSNKRILGLLADISARIPTTVGLRVSRLAINRETVSIRGTTDTFNSVEIIKSSLSASPHFKSVQIVSATADKEKTNGAIRFDVQLQLEGL
jgi:general secretion pathway protein L